jgi:bifunctional DNase/RNase
MTRDADFKRLVRARMQSTGESYTAVRASLLRQKEVPMPLIPCAVTVKIRTDDEVAAARAKLEAYALEQGLTVTEDDLEKLALPHVHLHEIDGDRKMWFLCRVPEGAAIQWALEGVQLERPMTHDMLRDVVAAMGDAKEVRVTELRDTTFYAELVVTDRTGAEQAISCRPSDGVALAVRAHIPILVAEALLATA